MAETVRVYAGVLGARLRSQLEYRLSFVFDCLADLLAQATELMAILVLFSQVSALGGFSREEVLLLYALASTGFGFADLAVGQIGGLPGYVRHGAFDTLLMRPMSTLGQLLASDVQLRRIGRVLVGAGTLGYILSISDIHWTGARVVLAVTSPLTGAVIIGSVWITSSSVSFWLVDAQELTGAVTHGTNLFTSYPLTIFPELLRRLLAFAIPGAFVSYYPMLALLDRPDPLGGPALLSWSGPPIAVGCVVLTALVWRLAVRRYQGTGS